MNSASMNLAYPVCCQSYYRVSPLAAVECLVGRCRGMCRESQDRVECRHWIETPIEPEHKFVEVSPQVTVAKAWMRPKQPCFEV